MTDNDPIWMSAPLYLQLTVKLGIHGNVHRYLLITLRYEHVGFSVEEIKFGSGAVLDLNALERVFGGNLRLLTGLWVARRCSISDREIIKNIL